MDQWHGAGNQKRPGEGHCHDVEHYRWVEGWTLGRTTMKSTRTVLCHLHHLLIPGSRLFALLERSAALIRSLLLSLTHSIRKSDLGMNQMRRLKKVSDQCGLRVRGIYAGVSNRLRFCRIRQKISQWQKGSMGERKVIANGDYSKSVEEDWCWGGIMFDL